MARLKPQYETFCQYYVRFLNAGEAAEHAGYAYSNRYQQGCRLLQRPHVARRIAELRAEIAERECLSLAALLSKLEVALQHASSSKHAANEVKVILAEADLLTRFDQAEALVAAAAPPGAAPRGADAAVPAPATASAAAAPAVPPEPPPAAPAAPPASPAAAPPASPAAAPLASLAAGDLKRVGLEAVARSLARRRLTPAG